MLTFVTSNTLAFVSEVRALVRVQIRAFAALLAVSKPSECIANLSCWADTNVRKPALLICAPRFLEMKAGRDVVWGRLVGESTVIASLAIVLVKPSLAERLFVRIVEKGAAVAGT